MLDVATPRSLCDPAERTRRQQMLTLPHMAALNAYVGCLRTPEIEVPNFDPLDGGADARALYLLEKPGPMTVDAGGSGFISRDNDDSTAEAISCFMQRSRIPRERTVIWNVIPGWNKTVQIKADELQNGIDELPHLLAVLQKLRVVVLVGGRAARAEPYLSEYKVFKSSHPSPQVRGTRPHLWNSIPDQWAQVLPFLD